MRGAIHHLNLTVSGVDRAFSLYDAVLRALGFDLREHTPRYCEWVHREDRRLSVSLHGAEGPNAARPHDRYAPGLHHLAWAADSRDAVDALFSVVQSAGGLILDAPADYPQYNGGKGYYAFFFADPDGIKLEIVWTPPAVP